MYKYTLGNHLHCAIMASYIFLEQILFIGRGGGGGGCGATGGWHQAAGKQQDQSGKRSNHQLVTRPHYKKGTSSADIV